MWKVEPKRAAILPDDPHRDPFCRRRPERLGDRHLQFGLAQRRAASFGQPFLGGPLAELGPGRGREAFEHVLRLEKRHLRPFGDTAASLNGGQHREQQPGDHAHHTQGDNQFKNQSAAPHSPRHAAWGFPTNHRVQRIDGRSPPNS